MTQLPSPVGPNPSVPQPVLSGPAGKRSGVFGSNPNNNIAAGSTLFNGLGGGFSAPESVRNFPLPFNGILADLFVVTSTGQPAGQSLTLTVRLNGANTGIVIVIPGGAAAGTYSTAGTGLTAQALAGGLVCIQGTQQAGASPSATITSWTLVAQEA